MENIEETPSQISAKCLETIYSYANVGITLVSASGHFIHANPKFCEMTGYSADEVCKLHFRDITHPDSLEASENLYNEIQSCPTGTAVREKQYLHKRGHSLWVKISINCVRDENGKIVHFIGVTEDITQQKRTNELLKHQRQVLELMAQNLSLHETLSNVAQLIEKLAPGAVATVCLIENGILVVGAAPSLPKDFEKEVAGFAVGPNSGSCGAAAFYKKRIVSQNIATDSWWPDRLRCKLLSCGIQAAWSTPVLSQSGEAIGTINLCWSERKAPTETDIELIEVAQQLVAIAIERGRTERLLRDQQMKMMSSSKLAALGEMAGGLSHEINNPLAIIAIKASELREAVFSNRLTNELASKTSERILETTERISKIIKGLRAFARDDENEFPREVSVESILEDTLSFCRERFKTHSIALCLKVAPGLKLRCRPVQISQVLLNLLNNSHDAVEGSVEKWIEVEAKDSGDSIVVSVTDSGSGISEKYSDQIFQPFFTTKEVSKGTGLGLSISASIVSSHKGTLSLDSQSKHTRFLMTLPKNPLLSTSPSSVAEAGVQKENTNFEARL